MASLCDIHFGRHHGVCITLWVDLLLSYFDSLRLQGLLACHLGWVDFNTLLYYLHSVHVTSCCVLCPKAQFMEIFADINYGHKTAYYGQRTLWIQKSELLFLWVFYDLIMNPISLSHLKKPSAVLAPSESSQPVGLEGLRNRPVPPIQPSSNNLRPAGKEGHLCAFSLGTICTRPIFSLRYLPPIRPSSNNLCQQRNLFHSAQFHQSDLPQTTTYAGKESFHLSSHLLPTGREGLQLCLFTWSTFPFNPLFCSAHFFILPLFIT